MRVTELLEKIRQTYLSTFSSEVEKLQASGQKLILEGEILKSEGELATSGFLGTPYRGDIVIVENGVATKSIMIDSQRRMKFETIRFDFSDSMQVELNPFDWDYATFKFASDIAIDFTKIKTWFLSSFESQSDESVFQNSVHYLSDPKEVEGKTEITVDFGSGTVDHFNDLLEVCSDIGIDQVTVE